MKFYTVIFGVFSLFIGGVIVLNAGRHPSSPQVATPADAQRDREAAALSRAQHVIKQLTRDPAAVKWNECVAWTKADQISVSIDFTAPNGFGGPVRETWYFTTDAAGKLVSLLTPKGEQVK